MVLGAVVFSGMMQGMEKQNVQKVALVANAFIAVMEIGAVAFSLTHRGVATFMFYTVLSNLLGGIACAVCFACGVRAMRRGLPLPRFARWMKYAASCCLLMTFFVVLLVLAPTYCAAGMDGYYLMFCVRELPVTHLLGPLLVFGSYVLLDADRAMTLRQSLVGFIPTLAYAAVAYPCNIARVWEGPYPFFFVWNMPVWQSVAWFFALCAMAICLCQIPRLVGNKLGT
jgi:hypothetical protein